MIIQYQRGWFPTDGLGNLEVYGIIEQVMSMCVGNLWRS